MKLLPEEGKIKDVFKDDGGMHHIVYSSKKRKPKVDAETLRERKRKRNAEYKLRPDVKQRLREKVKERRQKEDVKQKGRKRNAEYKLRPDVKQRLREKDKERLQKEDVKQKGKERRQKEDVKQKGKERRQKEDAKQKDRERHQTDNAKQRRKEKKKLRRNEEIHDKKANDDILIDEIRKELISAGINKLHDLPNI